MGTDRRDFLKQAAAALGGVSLSACGGGGGADEPSAGAPAPAPTPAPPPPAPAPAPTPTPTPTPPPAPAPAPPPPVSATATFTLVNGGSTRATHFCLGQAFRPGEMPDGVTCQELDNFQATILNRWPDGSVRFALLAGSVTMAAGETRTFELARGGAVVADPVAESVLAATGISAELSFEPVGSVQLQALIGRSSLYDAASGRFSPGRVRTLVAGPQMSSWVYYAPIGGHAHLSAWFEVRCWADGAVELLPWVENGWWNVAAPSDATGSLRFLLDGVERMQATLTLPHHARAAALGSDPAPWRRGGDWAEFRHDTSYLQATGLVPTYGAVPDAAALARQVSTYQPLHHANMAPSMGSGGYSRQIGLLPEWDVAYLISGADPRIYRSVLVNALAHGRWHVHFRDETTNRPVSPTAYPTRVISTAGGKSGIASIGASTTNDYTPAVAGDTPSYYWADSHHCSAGFMAYLVSGWNYFIEETQFVASVCTYKMHDGFRRGASSLFLPDQTLQPRGVAWCNRTVAQAATLTPDDDSARAPYVAVLEANIAYNHAIYVAQPNNVFGLMAPYGDAYTPAARGTTIAGSSATTILFDTNAIPSDNTYTGWTLIIGGQERKVTAYVGATRTATVDAPFTVGTTTMAYLLSDKMNRVPMWMEDFMTGVFGYQLAMQVPVSGGGLDKLRAFFHWKAKSVVGRFGTPGKSDEFNYCDAAQYELAAAPTDTPDFNGGSGPWYPHWGAIYEATTGRPNVATANDRLRGAYFPTASSYWGNLLPALAYAVTHGASGATEAYARMTSDPGWPAFMDSANAEPVWSVRPAH